MMPDTQCTRKERVGVITLPGNFNYGNRLQLYATMHVYESLGFQPRCLELAIAHSPILHPKQLIGAKHVNRYRSHEDYSTPERLEAFHRFNSLFDTRRYQRINDSLRLEYDWFSVGSDQVWNPQFITTCCDRKRIKRFYRRIVDRRAIETSLDWYFLRFANRNQRIALAPSVGLDSLNKYETRLIRQGVRGFNDVSVREQRGADMLLEEFGIQATVLPDPTLMLTNANWSKVADSRLTPKEPYVFAYLLGETGPEAQAALKEASQSGRLRIVQLSDRQQPYEPDAGPAEFIDLIRNAEHVVTDSYHGTIFSCIFHVPLTITRREGSTLQMFSRIEQLASTYMLRSRIYGTDAFDTTKQGDYSLFDNRIELERGRFLEYLLKATSRYNRSGSIL